MDTTEKVKSRWTRSFFTGLNTRGEEEREVCDICHKDFASPSNLTLHRSTHVIERRYKCEPCQVSFHSQGHLQKHKRSSAHETRVEMTQAFGVPTSDNPRPYGCPECNTAFRKHGHLAKHLRSKSHITKLEANGLIPMGTYAALEKCGSELKDKLITTNCEQSLHSLRKIAMQLFQHNLELVPLHSPESQMLSPSNSNSIQAGCLLDQTPPPPPPPPISSSAGPSGAGGDEQAAAHLSLMSMMAPHQQHQPAQSLDYTLRMGVPITGVQAQPRTLLHPQIGMIDTHNNGTTSAGPHAPHAQQRPFEPSDFSAQVIGCGNFVPTSTHPPTTAVAGFGSHSPVSNQVLVSSPPPPPPPPPPLLPPSTVPQQAPQQLDINQRITSATFLPSQQQPHLHQSSVNHHQPQHHNHHHHQNHHHHHQPQQFSQNHPQLQVQQQQQQQHYVNVAAPISTSSSQATTAYHQQAGNNLNHHYQQAPMAFKLPPVQPYGMSQTADMQQPDGL